MNLGIIGLDSSHAVQFSRILNGKNELFHISGHPVTAAYPGPVSSDFDMSRERMENFTRSVAEEWGVKLYASIAEVMNHSDAVFLEQVDARRRLSQFREIVRFGKPIYVDKPFALSTEDCKAMLKLAKEYSVPVLSTSSLRFADSLTAALKQCELHSVVGADFFGPMPFTPTQPGYFWYGVHMADMLYRTMGTGCSKVSVIHTRQHDVITGVWKDGRIGSIRGNRCGNGNFGGTVYHESGSVFVDVSQDTRGYYECLVEQIIKMFDTGQSPVTNREMTEVVRFLEAAGESLNTGREVEL